jgi:hypothetical protein
LRPAWDYDGPTTPELTEVYYLFNRDVPLERNLAKQEKVIELLRETYGRRAIFSDYKYFPIKGNEILWAIDAGDGRYSVLVNIAEDYGYWYFGDGRPFDLYEIKDFQKLRAELEKLYEEEIDGIRPDKEENIKG